MIKLDKNTFIFIVQEINDKLMRKELGVNVF